MLDLKGMSLLLLVVAVAPLHAAEVRLRSSAGCRTPIVRLSDVAEILGSNDLAMALGDVPLCPAPAAGQRRMLSQNDIRQLLALSGVEPATVQITGSDSVTVASDSASAHSTTKTLGAQSTMVRQAVFTSESEANRKQPVLAPAMQPETTQLASPENAPARIVERGASVTVHAQAAGVRIRTSGKALEPGGTGETITVELADSKEKVQARIVGPQLVEVTVGSKTAAR